MQSVVGYAGTPAGGGCGDVRACGGCRERIAGDPVRDRTGAKSPRFFGSVPGGRTVFFGKNGNRCELERLDKTGGSYRNMKKRDAARPAFLFVVLRPVANSS